MALAAKVVGRAQPQRQSRHAGGHVNDSEYNAGPNITTLIEPTPLTAGVPSLSTSGETLTIEESMTLEGENGDRRNVGDEHE